MALKTDSFAPGGALGLGSDGTGGGLSGAFFTSAPSPVGVMFAADVDSTLTAVNGARFSTRSASSTRQAPLWWMPCRFSTASMASAICLRRSASRPTRALAAPLCLLQLDADHAHACRRCALGRLRRFRGLCGFRQHWLERGPRAHQRRAGGAGHRGPGGVASPRLKRRASRVAAAGAQPCSRELRGTDASRKSI